MAEIIMLNAKDVQRILKVSQAKAYEIKGVLKKNELDSVLMEELTTIIELMQRKSL